MLLSFSHATMRPMLVRGIHDADRRPRKRGIDGPIILDRHQHDRVKRQTIRVDTGSDGRYHGLKLGAPLQLWWKSRTPERAHLGTVHLADKLQVRMHLRELLDLRILYKSPVKSDWKSVDDNFARADGFDSADDMAMWFFASHKHSFVDMWLLMW